MPNQPRFEALNRWNTSRYELSGHWKNPVNCLLKKPCHLFIWFIHSFFFFSQKGDSVKEMAEENYVHFITILDGIIILPGHTVGWTTWKFIFCWDMLQVANLSLWENLKTLLKKGIEDLERFEGNKRKLLHWARTLWQL